MSSLPCPHPLRVHFVKPQGVIEYVILLVDRCRKAIGKPLAFLFFWPAFAEMIIFNCLKTQNMKKFLIFFLCLVADATFGQTAGLPYYQIPDYPEKYTAGAVAARMVDGLGFRYYWATEGLRAEDLAYVPSEGARSSFETLQHINGLCLIIKNAASRQPTTAGASAELDFEALRKQTLTNIKVAADILRTASAEDLASFDMVFQNTNGTQEYPFWNALNGPIADALWHVGQVVTFRRSSGNPLPEGVGVLVGRKY